MIRSRNYSVYASHFDNMPDTLFKSGKPQSKNSNSQRCTIITACLSHEQRIFSTKLYRWRAGERAALLSSIPHYEDVTKFLMNDQFIRPASPEIVHYLQNKHFDYLLGDIVQDRGEYVLYIGSSARNYISVRREGDSWTHKFSFDKERDFYRFLGIVISDVFMDYWLTVGSGFNVTKGNILCFPVSEEFDRLIRSSILEIKSLWERRGSLEKTKMNAGKVIRSYDFSRAMKKCLYKV